MPLTVTPTALPEVWLIGHPVHADARGRFEELWRSEDYLALGLPPFVQDNASSSLHGVIRGLHYQWPSPQGKLVSVLCGAIWDVAVDVRPASARFGRYVAIALAAGDGHQLWIPPGFAHGFCALSASAQVLYKVTAPRVPEAERVVAWDDPDLGIPWPPRGPLLSPRDAAAPRLRELEALGLLPSLP